MKKLLLALAFLLVLSSQVKADALSVGETLKKIPPLKQGLAWSLVDNKLNYLSTIQVASFKNVSLELGYAGNAQNTGSKAVAVISYPIAKLRDYGVTLPILDLVELNIGAYAGYGRIQLNDGMGNSNNEWDAGISATLLNIKF